MDKPMIYKQMSLVMRDIQPIAKDSQNVQQGFKFRGIDAVYAALHDILVSHGVFYVPNVLSYERMERVTKSGTAMYGCIATVEYTFYAEDGSSVKATTIGKGEDMGDKETNKALSGALKYALIESFCIPTKGVTDDGDKDSPEESMADTPKPAPRGAQAPTGAPKMMSEAQSKKMHVCFNELEITDKAERMAYVNEVLRIMGASPVESSSMLTSKQASEIIGKLIDDKKVSDSARSADAPHEQTDIEPF